MKRHVYVIAAALMLAVGLGVFFYPTLASWHNTNRQANIVEQYEQEAAALPASYIEALIFRATEVNQQLSQRDPAANLYIGPAAILPEDYTEILSVSDVMGHLEIPVIDLNLPIFHTTEADVLERGVGHLEGTSFPVGGESTHAALTAHAAHPSSVLFSDLEGNVNIGDFFYINILGKRLAYQVDQINVVYPHEVESLRIVPGEDFVTLITCTPSAINTHRLLVRGRRVLDEAN